MLKISVVTIVLNRRDFLLRAIESVLAQGYPAFEHIVIDGGSTDGTLEALTRYDHLRLVSEPDDGQADAMNKGLALATGEVFAWLNSDDTYPPGAFATVDRHFQAHPEAVMLYGTCHLVDRHDRPLGRSRFHRFDRNRLMMGYNNVNTPAVFARLEAIRRAGWMDVSLRATYDLDMWIRLARLGPVLAVAEPLSNLCLHADSGLVSTRHHLAEAEVLRRRYRAEVPAFDWFVRQPWYRLRHRLYQTFKFNPMLRRI